MGGGDLNLKKSWHPHTMKNQERVWKAEQSKNQEERKLNDLRKEIEEEKNREELKRIGEASGVLKSDGDKKLEWMYKNSAELINREEYLLGRTIDKSFEILQAEEQRGEQQNMLGVKQPLNHVEHECIPFSIRSFRGTESTEQVDLQRKVMEDPLMLIKQREMDSRRKLLENPVKLKELHRILKTEQVLAKKKKSKSHKKEKKAKKDKKKSKRKHKKRTRSSSSSSSSSTTEHSELESGKDLDRELAKRYKKLKNSLESEQQHSSGISLSKLLDAKYDTISKELDKASKTKSKPSSSRDSRHRRRSRSSTDDSDHSRAPSRHHRRDERDTEQRRNRRPSPELAMRYERNDNDERRRYERRPPARREHQRSRSPRNRTTNAHTKKPTLTEEEKESRRREMMQNAAWRENDRTTAVQKHRDAYAHEEEQSRLHEFDKEFINKEVRKAIASQTSVGSRIRSNLNNIQRTSVAMDSNFARK